jgi:intracellular multiplication protein IcmC
MLMQAATPTTSLTAIQVLGNISIIIRPLILVVQIVFVLMGLYLTVNGIIELWNAGDENVRRLFASKHQPTFIGSCARVVIGSLMLGLGTLEFVGMLSKTLTTDYVNDPYMSYAPPGSGDYQSQTIFALGVIFGFLQIIGLIGMGRGVMTFNALSRGDSRHSSGEAFFFLIGGLGCWLGEWVGDILANTTGIHPWQYLGLT